jgi:hypothetical protein
MFSKGNQEVRRVERAAARLMAHSTATEVGDIGRDGTAQVSGSTVGFGRRA